MSTYAEPHAETTICLGRADRLAAAGRVGDRRRPAPGRRGVEPLRRLAHHPRVWECTPGKFTWVFSYDETLVVVEGRATVELDTGETVELAPGVMAFFGRGHDATWTVHETLRKGFHADSPDPLPF